jgi:hypothetical protein
MVSVSYARAIGTFDLREGSELDIHIFSDASTDIEDGVLKASGVPKFE